MSRDLGGWIHSFAVTDTQKHKNGYTIYKITSIVFPRALPETLTSLTVWRRFNEIKRLHREMARRHKSLQLPGKLPEPTDSTYFNRFEENVIQRRKDYILQFLDFVAQYPPLYKSHAFTQFITDTLAPNNSPPPTLSRQNALTLNNSLNNMKSVHEPLTAIKSIEAEPNDDNYDADGGVVNDSERKDYSRFLTPMESIESDDSDYIYEAALEFSRAVQAEADLDYDEAHKRYKNGVELLLNGCKDDGNDDRRFIAKTKIAKYLARADEIYEQFLSTKQNSLMPTNFELSVDVGVSAGSSAIFLERPWNHLAKYKVVEVLNERVMKVQCITEPQQPTYIMKGVEKPSSNSPAQSVFLPTRIPYMVDLLAFFQSEQKLFILLSVAEGGRLYDYVKQYTPTRKKIITINELFPEIFEIVDSTSQCNDNSEIVEALELDEVSAAHEEVDSVQDIVRSSQKLLASVDHTLHKIQAIDEKKLNIEPSGTTDDSFDGLSTKVIRIPYQLPEACLKQWARELAIGIKSLHSKGVILADLHMGNLLLGCKGQLLLTYFYQNECTEMPDIQPVLKDYNQVALSGHFVAPDRPITSRSDWWSYGIILYQLLTGVPFKNMHPGYIELYGCVQYPEDIEISESARDLLDNLLQQVPEERLNFEQIQRHIFFADTNWEQVERDGLSGCK